MKTASHEGTGRDAVHQKLMKHLSESSNFVEKCHRNFLLKSLEIKCVILRCAMFIVPRELCVSEFVGNIIGQSLKLALAGILHTVVQDTCGRSAKNETKKLPFSSRGVTREGHGGHAQPPPPPP